MKTLLTILMLLPLGVAAFEPEDLEKAKGGRCPGCDLWGINLEGAELPNANLSGANLFRGDLTGADLTGADLTGAILFEADLSGAALTGAIPKKGVKFCPGRARADRHHP